MIKNQTNNKKNNNKKTKKLTKQFILENHSGMNRKTMAFPGFYLTMNLPIL